jgi:hypothetical protein
MERLDVKPRLMLRTQFTIPTPHRAWCHDCNRGFASLEEMTEAHPYGVPCIPLEQRHRRERAVLEAGRG